MASDIQAEYDRKIAEQDAEYTAFAEKHGGLSVNVLKDVAGNKFANLYEPGAQALYNDIEPKVRQWADDKTPRPWVDPPQPMQAPTLRGAQQCYCLVCKRKVKPVGARIVGNRCCGTCPLCRRKVCTFVAKTQARQQPAKRRVRVKKSGKTMKKSA